MRLPFFTLGGGAGTNPSRIFACISFSSAMRRCRRILACSLDVRYMGFAVGA